MRIVLAILLCLGVTAWGEDATGTVEGSITFEGKVPKHLERDDAGYYRDLLEVDKDSKGLLNVMVYLEPVRQHSQEKEPVEALPDVSIHQEYFAFLPGVVGVRVGQSVLFTNGDPANHNVRAKADIQRNQFNVMTTMQMDYEKSFHEEPEERPIHLTCDIHRWMEGWIYVFEHGWFSVTNESGNFSIPSVPVGNYLLVVEQPDATMRTETYIRIDPNSTLDFRVQFTPRHLHASASPVISVTASP